MDDDEDEAPPAESAEEFVRGLPITYYRLLVFRPGEVRHPAWSFTSATPFAPLVVGDLVNLSGSVLAGDAPVESILKITVVEHDLAVIEEGALLCHAVNLYTQAVANSPQARRREMHRNETRPPQACGRRFLATLGAFLRGGR